MTKLFLVALAIAGLLLGQRNATVEEAWRLAANGQREQALSLLEGVVSKDPRDADARLLMGSLLMEAGRGTDAITQLTEALELRPSSAEAQNALGEAYNSVGNMRAARGPFEKAVALKPAYAVAQMNLGEALLNVGEAIPAAQHLDRAIKLLGRGDDLANACYLRAKLYTSAGDVAKAAGRLQQAVAIRPNFPQAWSDLGEARRTLLDDTAAMAAFTRAVEQAPDDAVAQYRLGAEYLEMDKANAAVEHLEIAYQLTPDDQSVLNALQRALRLDGRAREADDIKKKLAEQLRANDQDKQNSLTSTSLNNEGASLEKTGDLAGALKKYQAAAQLAPKNVQIRVNVAIALLRLGKWTDGLNELHAALLLDPMDAKIQQTFKEALAQAPAGAIPDWNRR